MDYNLISFLALSLTGMIIMSFGSLFCWLMCEMMNVTKKMLICPIVLGAGIVYAAITFFYLGLVP